MCNILNLQEALTVKEEKSESRRSSLVVEDKVTLEDGKFKRKSSIKVIVNNSLKFTHCN